MMYRHNIYNFITNNKIVKLLVIKLPLIIRVNCFKLSISIKNNTKIYKI